MNDVNQNAGTKLYQGSCHCGAVRYEATLNLGAVTKCNCTICMKVNQTGAIMKPRDFRLLAGADHTSEYFVGNSPNGRVFCKRCGIHVYGVGNVPEIGGEFVSVNVNTLDGVELTTLKPKHHDGRHNNWQAGTRDEAWPMLP